MSKAQAQRKVRAMTKPQPQYRTIEFLPLPGAFFPDMDLDFLINGQKHMRFGAQFDGKVWRVNFYDTQPGATIEVLKKNGEPHDFVEIDLTER